MDKNCFQLLLVLFMVFSSPIASSADLFDKLKEKVEKAVGGVKGDLTDNLEKNQKSQSRERSNKTSKDGKSIDFANLLQGDWGTIETCGFKKLTNVSLNNFSVRVEGKSIEFAHDAMFMGGSVCNADTGWGCEIAKSKVGRPVAYKKKGEIVAANSAGDSFLFKQVIPLNFFDDFSSKNYISEVIEYEYRNGSLRTKRHAELYQQMDVYDRKTVKHDNLEKRYVEDFKYVDDILVKLYGSNDSLRYLKCDDENNQQAISQWMEQNKQIALAGDENTKKCTASFEFLDKAATRAAKKQLEMMVGELGAKSDRTWQFEVKSQFCPAGDRVEVCSSNDRCRNWVMESFEVAKKSWRSEAADDLFVKYKNYMFLTDCHDIRKDYVKKYIDPDVYKRVKGKMKKLETDALKLDPSINKDKLWDEAAIEYKLTLGMLSTSSKANPQNFDREMAGQCQMRISQMDGGLVPTKDEDFKVKKDF
jgi:hypothetical protein